MSLGDVKAWLEIVEIALKCVAIVAAGVWAVVLLLFLRQREQAQASLRKTEAEIRNLELESRQQAVVRVDIKSTAHRSPKGNGYVILTTVDLTNRGSRNTRIKWRGELPAFYVRPVHFDAEGKPRFGKETTEFRPMLTVAPDQEPISHVIRAGGTESIPFAFRVAASGLYLLSFRGVVEERERALSEESGALMPTTWTASRYLVVE